MGKLGIGEISQNGRLGRPLHGEVMMRSCPKLMLSFVTGGTRLSAHIRRGFSPAYIGPSPFTEGRLSVVETLPDQKGSDAHSDPNSKDRKKNES